MSKLTKEELRKELGKACDERDIQQIALVDIIRGDFVEFKNRKHRLVLKLCRPSSCTGGIAVLCYGEAGQEYVEADYLDRRVAFWRSQTPFTDEQAAVRDLYNEAIAYRNKLVS